MKQPYSLRPSRCFLRKRVYNADSRSVVRLYQ